ncbi:hypothetical protein NY406_06305 [Chlorobaculum sp. MV4-Y]|uniref:hypothetical protein n=1 Tax=Chlorobaculum sp. MV4-Y TaxID=2976335 RepID=UPI0021AEFDCE|nr:hypothetical protein [Chlorobaculum sp. MV4-Y]UWX56866.1 hypothetical protein NY406_06305 [Chlorobaculum sp. MV4-Y]
MLKHLRTLLFTFLLANPVLKVSSMNDLARLGRIAMGNPNSATAGEMAMEATK